MSRNLTAAVITEIKAANLRPVLFVQAYFTSGWLYLSSAYGSIDWNGQTWTGAGNLLSISPLQETTEVTAQGMALSLSGIPADLITKALGEIRQGAPVKIWQGFLSGTAGSESWIDPGFVDSGWVQAGVDVPLVVSVPFNAWSGRLDTCTIEEGGDTATITITAESRLMDLNRARELRTEHQSQQINYPGDFGFEFVPGLQELNLTWGGGGIPMAPPNLGGPHGRAPGLGNILP